MGIRTAVGAALLLGSATLQAADAKMLQGVGTTSCGQFARMYALSPKQAEMYYFSWAQGFMSALNFSDAAMGDAQNNHELSATEGQMAAIRAYCDKHPLADYYVAVLVVYKGLPHRDIKKKLPP